jgi:hypothetical protein
MKDSSEFASSPVQEFASSLVKLGLKIATAKKISLNLVMVIAIDDGDLHISSISRPDVFISSTVEAVGKEISALMSKRLIGDADVVRRESN